MRERADDIPLLVDHFIRQLRQRSRKKISGLSAETMDIFMNYFWPGNVRELKGALEYAFVIAEKGLILPEQLPVRMLRPECRAGSGPLLPSSRSTDEKAALIDALIKCRGNQTQAAKMLGINRVTVWHSIKKHGVNLRDLSDSR